MITFSRRSILAGATGLAALLPVASSGWAGLAVAEYLDFDVSRNGSDIGHHRIDIRHEGNRTIAKIDILLEVGLGPLVLYRYRHQNTEIWQNGEFLSFSSTTDDDGTPYAVRATRTGRTIRVERDHDADYEIDDPSILPTTYWNEALIRGSKMLDTQKGRIMEVDVAAADWVMIPTASGPVEARRFDVTGDLTLSLWYDRQGRWTGLTFPLKGAEFEYQRV